MREVITIFITVFVAELGDKTQLATMLFATDQNLGRTGVFLAASAALIASTLLAVIFGELVTKIIPPSSLKIAAGVGFIAVGIWTLISAGR